MASHYLSLSLVLLVLTISKVSVEKLDPALIDNPSCYIPNTNPYVEDAMASFQNTKTKQCVNSKQPFLVSFVRANQSSPFVINIDSKKFTAVDLKAPVCCMKFATRVANTDNKVK